MLFVLSFSLLSTAVQFSGRHFENFVVICDLVIEYLDWLPSVQACICGPSLGHCGQVGQRCGQAAGSSDGQCQTSSAKETASATSSSSKVARLILTSSFAYTQLGLRL